MTPNIPSSDEEASFTDSETSEMSETKCKQMLGYIDDFIDVKQSLAKDNAEFQHDLKSKQLELHQLREQNKLLQSQMYNLEQEYHHAQEHQQEITEAYEKSEHLQAMEISDLQQKITDLQLAEDSQKAMIQQKADEIALLTQNLQDLLTEKASISADLEAEREARSILNEEFNEANLKLDSCMDEKSQLAQDLSHIQQERKDLQAELEKYKTQCSELQTELDSRKKISDKIQKYTGQIQELQASRDILKAALDCKSKEFSELKKQYEELNKRKILRLKTMDLPGDSSGRLSISSMKSISSIQDSQPTDKSRRLLEKCLDKQIIENKDKTKIIGKLKQELASNKQNLKYTQKRLHQMEKESKEECLKLKSEIMKYRFKEKRLKQRLQRAVLFS